MSAAAPIAYSAPNVGVFVEAMRVDWIQASPLNPRRTFDPDALAELAESLKAHGMLEPVVVRQGFTFPCGHIMAVKGDEERQFWSTLTDRQLESSPIPRGSSTVRVPSISEGDDSNSQSARAKRTTGRTSVGGSQSNGDLEPSAFSGSSLLGPSIECGSGPSAPLGKSNGSWIAVCPTCGSSAPLPPLRSSPSGISWLVEPGCVGHPARIDISASTGANPTSPLPPSSDDLRAESSISGVPSASANLAAAPPQNGPVGRTTSFDPTSPQATSLLDISSDAAKEALGGDSGDLAFVELKAVGILIAGERRWRAAQLAGLTEIPARILADVDDSTALKLALVENLQRQDLDPIEEAEGYRQLNRVVGLKQSEIAATVHRSQPAIANAMRLLELPDDVIELIRAGKLTPSHGIALARFRAFPAITSRSAALAVEEGWTSKQLEKGIPDAFGLMREGLARNINGGTFDQTVCKKCPLDARRASDTYYGDLCLRPDHFEELTETVKAERIARQAELTQAIANGDPTVLPYLRDLKWDNYRRVENHSKPGGCSEVCPCRGKALDNKDAEVTICLDPHQRWAKLEGAETRARNKARRQRAAELRLQLATAIDQMAEIGPRELALIGAAGLTWSTERELAAAAERLSVALPFAQGAMRPQRIQSMADVSPLDLVKLLVEAQLRAELADENEWKNPKTSWYLGLEQPSEASA